MSSINDSDNVKEDRNGDVTLTVRTLMQGKVSTRCLTTKKESTYIL